MWPPRAVPPYGWQPPRRGGQVGSGRFHSMGVGELLDAIFSLYLRNFLLIVSISAVVQVPYAIVQFLLFEIAGYSSIAGLGFGRLTSPGSQPTITPQQLQGLQGVLSGVLIVSATLLVLAVFLIMPLGEAATTRAVSDRYLDRDASLGSSYGAAIRRLIPLIVQGLILFAGAVVLFGAAILLLVLLAAVAGAAGAVLGFAVFIAAVVAALYFYARTLLAPPAIVLEGLSGWRGIRRSWLLSQGHGWRLVGIRILIALITGIITFFLTTILTVAGLGLDPNGQFILTQVAAGLSAVMLNPIAYIAVTLLYYDTRIRKEAFDIEMLAQSL